MKSSKLSFHLVEPKVLELSAKLEDNQTLEQQVALMDKIDAYIELSGWTLEEWREETLRHIDANWDESKSSLN